MANDLIIGGSTYKNIDYIRVMRSDGTLATYYDRDRIDHRVMKASCQAVSGEAYSVEATSLATDTPEASQPTAISGESYVESAELDLASPETSISVEEVIEEATE